MQSLATPMITRRYSPIQNAADVQFYCTQYNTTVRRKGAFGLALTSETFLTLLTHIMVPSFMEIPQLSSDIASHNTDVKGRTTARRQDDRPQNMMLYWSHKQIYSI